jgi:hypothetical protein
VYIRVKMHRKREIFKLLSTIMAIVLVYFIFTSDSMSRGSNISSSEICAEPHFSQIPLFIENTIQVPVVHENSADLSNNLFIESNKIVADKRKINRDIIALKLSELSRRPLAVIRFYYPSRNKDPEDSQVLS